MAKAPDPLQGLLALIHDTAKTAEESRSGLLLLDYAVLSLLIDANLVTPERAIERLHQFLDQLPEDRRDGRQGSVLKAAIQFLSEPSSPTPDETPEWLRVIDGDLPD